MGGEGSMAAANNSLKNNRSLLSKRREKGALSGSYAHLKIKEFPKASPEELNEIKERIQKDARKYRLKLAITSIIFFVTLFIAIWYLIK
ncbi:hypothetical protein [Thalassobellus sediminis]|uniref:hypothetical protein n=1 Tax=Thalassobellus sediminis TaxID=3367753 RepID=UPI00379110DB